MRSVLTSFLFISWSAMLALTVSLAMGQTTSKPALESDTFLNFVIKLRDNGSSEVVQAKEVPGKVILRHDRVSDYFYEVTREGKTFAVGFLPEDPFVTRAFRDNERQGEQRRRADTATIVVNVPQTELTVAKSGKLGIRVYKIDNRVGVDEISPAEFEKLRSEGQITLKFEITGTELSRAVVPKQ